MIRRGGASKLISLTFDDGPTFGVTDKILNILKREKIKATFFVIGRKIEKNNLIIKRMADEGHEIGNHTYYHSRLTEINDKKFLAELRRTSDLIISHANEVDNLFRPPHGHLPAKKQKLIAKEKYRTVLWTVSADDYLRQKKGMRTADSIANRVVAQTRRGSIILMHDNSREIVAALPQMIKRLKAKGYKFATVSELMRVKTSRAGCYQVNAKTKKI